jgi:hypothetical protein
MTRTSRPGVERELVVLADALRRQRRGDHDALGLDLADALREQVRVDRRLVDRLHLARGLLLGELRDAREDLVGVLVARPDPLEVQDRQAAELADDAGRLGRHDAIHGRGHEREIEAGSHPASR